MFNDTFASKQLNLRNICSHIRIISSHIAYNYAYIVYVFDPFRYANVIHTYLLKADCVILDVYLC